MLLVYFDLFSSFGRFKSNIVRFISAINIGSFTDEAGVKKFFVNFQKQVDYMSASKEKKDKAAGLFEFVDEKKVGFAFLTQIQDAFWQKSDKNLDTLKEIIEKKTVIRVSWPSDKDEAKETVPAILLKTGSKYPHIYY